MATRIAERSPVAAQPRNWTIEDSRRLYNIEGWGARLLRHQRPRARGRAPRQGASRTRARPLRARDGSRGAGRRAAGAAALLRHPALAHRVAERASSSAAIEEFEYDGGYTTVYPIKVNQQRHVVEEIVQFGKPHGVGLECGSQAGAAGGARPHASPPTTSSSATATRTRSSCAWPSWARSSGTRSSSCSSS